LQDTLADVPHGVRFHIGAPPAAFDGLIHRPEGGGLILELERAGPSVDLSRHLERGLMTIITAGSLRSLGDETARIFREMTGYDRVMVYRFDDQGHGEVLSENCKPDIEPVLGHSAHRPAPV
jgi:light-regulated signal transduction histidine kinase (bacteriophytochrome)